MPLHRDGGKGFYAEPPRAASGPFSRGGGDLQLDVLGAEDGVMGGEAHLAWLFRSANPDGAGAANERKGIVADEFGRAGEFEADGVVGERADGVEFVRDAQHDAGGVRSICDERSVVGQQREFLIDALA